MDADRARPVDQERAPALARLGKYELLRLLARGGMAEIFLGRATGPEGFEKLAVVKRIRPELAVDERFVNMFMDEARLAATLRHSNVAQVYDIGIDGQNCWYAMELLEGCNLRELMDALERQRHRLPLEHAIYIVLNVCAGLHYAHERKDVAGRPLELVHRDVSPENLFVTRDGAVKLLDFGIARASQRLSETRAGVFKGKVGYVAPEQLRGVQPIDRRADIFALSVVLWELTTGRALFRGMDEYTTMRHTVEQDAPSPSTVVAHYPAQLEAILLRGLRRAPEERFQTALELQLALEQFMATSGLSSSPFALARLMVTLGDATQNAVQRAITQAHRAALEQGAERLTRPYSRPNALARAKRRDDQGVGALAPSTITRSKWSFRVIVLGAITAGVVIAGGALVRRSAREHPPATPGRSSSAPAPSSSPRPAEPSGAATSVTDMAAVSPLDASIPDVLPSRARRSRRGRGEAPRHPRHRMRPKRPNQLRRIDRDAPFPP